MVEEAPTHLNSFTPLPAKEKASLTQMLSDQRLELGQILFDSNVFGFNTTVFHQKCDGMGPTVTLLRVKSNNNWIGGYTTVSWKADEDIVGDNHAFLFNL